MFWRANITAWSGVKAGDAAGSAGGTTGPVVGEPDGPDADVPGGAGIAGNNSVGIAVGEAVVAKEVCETEAGEVGEAEAEVVAVRAGVIDADAELILPLP